MDWPNDFAGWMNRDLDRRLGSNNRWLAEALTLARVRRTRRDLPLDLWLAAAAAFDIDSRIDDSAVEPRTP